jgi:hypothetical protein
MPTLTFADGIECALAILTDAALHDPPAPVGDIYLYVKVHLEVLRDRGVLTTPESACLGCETLKQLHPGAYSPEAEHTKNVLLATLFKAQADQGSQLLEKALPYLKTHPTAPTAIVAVIEQTLDRRTPTLHLLRGGRAACGLYGVPKDWPARHKWTDSFEAVPAEERRRFTLCAACTQAEAEA